MHKEYKRIAEHSDKAILFIHGILGTPNHFRAFVPLVPENITVYNLLLDGHGKGVRDFSRTSMKKWEAQVAAAVKELSQNHNEIYVAAHSLGCLLAIDQAVRNPVIKKMFLLAVPLKLQLKPRMFLNSLKVYLNRIDPENEELVAAKACYGIHDSKNPFLYIGWVPRFLELFSKIKDTRKILESVKIPCAAYQSLRDEMVSNRAASILEQNPVISVFTLEHSSHFCYEKNDLALVTQRFKEFIS